MLKMVIKPPYENYWQGTTLCRSPSFFQGRDGMLYAWLIQNALVY